jgi:hypothetical protein
MMPAAVKSRRRAGVGEVGDETSVPDALHAQDDLNQRNQKANSNRDAIFRQILLIGFCDLADRSRSIPDPLNAGENRDQEYQHANSAKQQDGTKRTIAGSLRWRKKC